jgi:hypothetical protein
VVNEKVVDDIDELAFATTRSQRKGHQPSVGEKAGKGEGKRACLHASQTAKTLLAAYLSLRWSYQYQ